MTVAYSDSNDVTPARRASGQPADAAYAAVSGGDVMADILKV